MDPGVYFPAMRSVLAWLAVNAFFVAIAVAFSAVFFGLASIAKLVEASALEEHALVLGIGIVALAATLALAFKAMRLIGAAPSRDRVRGSG